MSRLLERLSELFDTTVLGRAARPKYETGASLPKRTAWYFVNLAVVYNPWIPLSLPRIWALRLFGARVGRGVCIKPHVKVKFPWKLSIGDHAGIGEECWIDNHADVVIGENATLSQRTYLCAANRDWIDAAKPVRPAPIRVGNNAWVGAGVVVAPGATIGEGSVVTMGSTVLKDLPANMICAGLPAEPVKPRWRKGTPAKKKKSRRNQRRREPT